MFPTDRFKFAQASFVFLCFCRGGPCRRRTGLLSSPCLSNFPPGRGGYGFSLWFLTESLSKARTLLSVYDDQGATLEIILLEEDVVLRYRPSKKDTGSTDSVVRYALTQLAISYSRFQI